MIKKNVSFILLLSLGVSNFAYASNKDSSYVILHGSYSQFNRPSKGFKATKFKDSYALGVGTGYHIDENFRADIRFNYNPEMKIRETSYNPSHKLHQKIESYAVMINGYYDFNNDSFFKPYIGAGIGYAINKSGNLKYDLNLKNYNGYNYYAQIKGKQHNNFVYQMSAGGMFKISKNVFLDIGYRHIDLGRYKTKSGMINRVNQITKLVKSKYINPKSGKLRGDELIIGIKFDL